jgi:hypothetical protein
MDHAHLAMHGLKHECGMEWLALESSDERGIVMAAAVRGSGRDSDAAELVDLSLLLI